MFFLKILNPKALITFELLKEIFLFVIYYYSKEEIYQYYCIIRSAKCNKNILLFPHKRILFLSHK